MVPMAILRARLQFARIAAVNLSEILAQQALIITFALLDFGPLSFVLPMPLVAAARALVLWWMVRPRVGWGARFAMWPDLYTAGRWVLGQRLLATATGQGDYIVLALVVADEFVVGRYFVAFLLATQVIRVVADNVTAVLTPGLNQLQAEPGRLSAAVDRACRVACAAIVPVCYLQALLIGPLLRLFTDVDRYGVLIVLVPILSIGPLLYSATWPLGSLMLVQQRFRASFLLWLAFAPLFFVIVYPATVAYGIYGTAAGVAAWGWCTAVLGAIVALNGLHGVKLLASVAWRPNLFSMLAALPLALLLWQFGGSVAGDLSLLLLGPVLLGSLYLLMAWRLDPVTASEMRRLGGGIAGKLARR
jgi:O-antigen/teichoic acid export membrane protein